MSQEIITGAKGTYTIPQGVGIVAYTLDVNLLKPALFKYLSTGPAANVNVVYWDDSTDLIDAAELSSLNMLIKQIKTGTTALAANIRLLV